MPKKQLTVRLVGLDQDQGQVRLHDFTSFCRSLQRCLKRAALAVDPSAKETYYRIVDLSAASAVVTLEPVAPTEGNDLSQEAVSLFRDTVSALQDGSAVDQRVTSDDLQVYRELARPLEKKAQAVSVDGCGLTLQYAANIDKILGSYLPAKGQVTGRLERLNVHDRYEFVLFPAIGKRVVCTFPDVLLDDVRQAIKRTVTVLGKVYYQPDNPMPDRVHVERMELHPLDSDLPTLKELRGMAPGCTGQMTSVEFVRAIRDK